MLARSIVAKEAAILAVRVLLASCGSRDSCEDSRDDQGELHGCVVEGFGLRMDKRFKVEKWNMLEMVRISHGNSPVPPFIYNIMRYQLRRTRGMMLVLLVPALWRGGEPRTGPPFYTAYLEPPVVGTT